MFFYFTVDIVVKNKPCAVLLHHINMIKYMLTEVKSIVFA